jgi:hypothetical protein
MKYHVNLLRTIFLLIICFMMITSINAARNSYWDGKSTSDILATTTPSGISTLAYSNPARVLWDDGINFAVIAYPSSYWDGRPGYGWEFKAYTVIWPHHVWIDQVTGDNYQDTTPITEATITFNPKGTAEGELTVDWSNDGKHNGCDFSAITGFEKETSWIHLSIWRSRGSYPQAV